MQKVVGSSPIIRSSEKPPKSQGFGSSGDLPQRAGDLEPLRALQSHAPADGVEGVASWIRAKTFTAIGPSGIEGTASRS
jgi:hypothetical protein